MTLRDDLIAAKALINTPEKWGKGKYEPSPGCYCILGALAKLAGSAATGSALRIALSGRFHPDNLVAFNDDPDTTHADVMALFDRAIARAS